MILTRPFADFSFRRAIRHFKFHVLWLSCVVLVGCASTKTTAPGSARETDAKVDQILGQIANLQPQLETGSNETARLAYNEACRDLVLTLQARKSLQTPQFDLTIKGGEAYTKFVSPDAVVHKIFRPKTPAAGYGGTLVGVYLPSNPRSQFLALTGVSSPVTAVVKVANSKAGSLRIATLTLLDSAKVKSVELAGRNRPLAADLRSPFGYYADPQLLGFEGMLDPAELEKRTGLYLIQPYDANKIPLLMVHGLSSAPQMWFPAMAEIEADPALRGKFQFWVFGYPTGDPIALSALKLRQSLAQAEVVYPKSKNMFVIGHSLGGLLTQMQVVNTKEVLWDAVFGQAAAKVRAELPADNEVRKALVFQANPGIQEVIFISTPHYGSNLATGTLAKVVSDIIALPVVVTKSVTGNVAKAVETAEGTTSLKIPNGVSGLSPKSPMLIALNTLKIVPPFYSIIGNQGKPGPLKDSTDGVVAYWSSHLAAAKAEYIVPGPHECCAMPQTIGYMKKILSKYLQTHD